MATILGLGGGYFHDASACLVVDGEIVAFAEEERFTRRKRNSGSRSCTYSAAYCLHHAGMRLRDFDEVAVGWNPTWPQHQGHVQESSQIRELLDPGFFEHDIPESLTVVGHHLAHAASTFYCSGFPRAAVVVADGAGDGVSTSVYVGDEQGLRLRRTYPFTQSLGWLYEAACHHAGVGRWAPGTLMGLAAYATDRQKLPFVTIEPNGYEIELPQAAGIDPNHASQTEIFEYLERLVKTYGIAFETHGRTRHARTSRYMPDTGRWSGLDFPPPSAVRLAADVQETVELCMIQVSREAIAESESNHLCIAGGVGLNCTSNGRLHRQLEPDGLFVQPASGDSGVAIGAALVLAKQHGDLPLGGRQLKSVALGPSFSTDAVRSTIERSGLRHQYVGESAAIRVAQEVASGRLVGWFDGRMEGGPRALGRRSILASPCNVASRDRVNIEVKLRESWRPFAPSISATNLHRYVQDELRPADFMIVAHESTEAARAELPAVVHVDGSLRPQCVHADGTPYSDLLEELDQQHGIGAVLNTSFNNDREPIVMNPDDALRTFATSALDVLAIEGHLVTKSG